MLFHPQPLASTNKIRSKSQQVIDPCFPRCGTMIGVVLHIQTNKGHGNAIGDCQGIRGSLNYPQELQVKEKRYITNGTEKVSRSPKFLSSTDNFEDFRLELSFKLGIKLVSNRTCKEVQYINKSETHSKNESSTTCTCTRHTRSTSRLA
jgi:hypothetical protein